jgi:hypothetical protein
MADDPTSSRRTLRLILTPKMADMVPPATIPIMDNNTSLFGQQHEPVLVPVQGDHQRSGKIQLQTAPSAGERRAGAPAPACPPQRNREGAQTQRLQEEQVVVMKPSRAKFLTVVFLASALLSGAARAGREEQFQTVVMSGRWGVPDQEPDSREARRQRWKLKARVAPDGSFGGSGSIRVGAERVAGNVVGRFSGYEVQAFLFTDDGVQMVQFDGTITGSGILGTFLTIGGDDAWFETTNRGFLSKILE